GAHVELEDLNSASGTRLDGTPVPAAIRAPIAPGQLIELGAVTVMLCPRALVPGKHRRAWPPEDFQGRVEGEWARAERSAETFALLRIRCQADPGVDPQLVLARVLRAPDVLGSYGPGEFEQLLIGVTRAQAEHVRERLAARLTENQITARFGLACYPQ